MKCSQGRKSTKRRVSFMCIPNTAGAIFQEIDDTTRFTRGKFPIIYLGCVIGHSRKTKNHFSELIKKMHNNLQA